LREEQRRRLDERSRHEGRSMASLIREAVDEYLAEAPDQEAALDGTFGSLPDLIAPSRDEWDRG
jgi:predicted DNA-binding protein